MERSRLISARPRPASAFPTLAYGGVAPYLNISPTNYSILLCPSDDPTYRKRHAEYVTRWFCASKSNAVPVPADFPSDPETEPPGP
jgi:hypothetical protein